MDGFGQVTNKALSFVILRTATPTMKGVDRWCESLPLALYQLVRDEDTTWKAVDEMLFRHSRGQCAFHGSLHFSCWNQSRERINKDAADNGRAVATFTESAWVASTGGITPSVNPAVEASARPSARSAQATSGTAG